MNFATIFMSRGNLKIAEETLFISWEFYFYIGSNINLLLILTLVGGHRVVTDSLVDQLPQSNYKDGSFVQNVENTFQLPRILVLIRKVLLTLMMKKVLLRLKHVIFLMRLKHGQQKKQRLKF